MSQYIKKQNCKMLVNSFIISYIDYCDALCYGLADCLVKISNCKL